MSIELALKQIDGEYDVEERGVLSDAEKFDPNDPYHLQMTKEQIARIEREVRLDDWRFRQENRSQEVPANASLDPVQRFMLEASRHRLLKPPEEVELAKRIEKGDLVAKDRMINSNLRLVVANARRYQGQGLELADLIQEGSLGLIRSVEKFDWRKGFRFSTYSTLWIRQAIQRGLENTSRTIRLPVHMAQRARKIGRVERELTAKLGHEPDDEAIAQAAELSLADVIQIRKAEKAIVSLDKPLGDEDGATFGDMQTDKNSGPEEETELEIGNTMLGTAISELPEREKQVIEMRFLESKTLADVGRALSITVERARQIEAQALNRLGKRPDLIYWNNGDK